MYVVCGMFMYVCMYVCVPWYIDTGGSTRTYYTAATCVHTFMCVYFLNLYPVVPVCTPQILDTT
jgi:hypothetical protein